MLSKQQAAGRLRQIGARFKKQAGAQEAYWSRTQKAWVIKEPAGSSYFRLSYYKTSSCPC